MSMRRGVSLFKRALGLTELLEAPLHPNLCVTLLHACSTPHYAEGFQRHLKQLPPQSSIYNRKNYQALKRGKWASEIAATVLSHSQPDISHRAITRSIMGCQSLIELQTLVDRHLDHLSPINVAAAITRLPKLVRGHACLEDVSAAPLLDKLIPLCEAYIPQLSVRDITNCIWSLGKLRYQPYQRFIHAISEELLRNGSYKLSQAEPVHLTCLVVGMGAVFSGQQPQLWEEVAVQVVGTPLDTQAVVCIAKAYAASGLSGLGDFWDYVAQAAVVAFPKMSPHEICIFAQALSSGKFSSIEALKALNALPETKLWEFRPHEMTTLVVSASKLDRSKAFLKKAAKLIKINLVDYSTRDIANVLWALAHIPYAPVDLLSSIVNHLALACPAAPRDLASILWAYGRLCPASKELIATVQTQMALMIEEFHPRELVLVLEAHMFAYMNDSDFLGRASRILEANARDLTAGEAARAGMVYSYFNLEKPVLLSVKAQGAS